MEQQELNELPKTAPLGLPLGSIKRLVGFVEKAQI